jgi:hypothetical protein
MKQLSLLLIIAISLWFSTGCQHSSGKSRSTDSLFTKLKKTVERVDEYYRTHSDDFTTLAKVSGVDTLLEITDPTKWPAKYDYSYVVLKDTSGRIIYIDKILDSEKEKSIQICIHYFDEHGNTYAFRTKESMVFENVKERMMMVIDDHLKYYNRDFKMINESDTVRNVINHSLVALTKDERKQMDFKYDVYRNLHSCLKGYNIKLKN